MGKPGRGVIRSLQGLGDEHADELYARADAVVVLATKSTESKDAPGDGASYCMAIRGHPDLVGCLLNYADDALCAQDPEGAEPLEDEEEDAE